MFHFYMSKTMSLELLKTLRVGKGITQLELAELLKKPQSFVSKYESGERRIDVFEFIAICRALNEEPEKTIKILEMERKNGF